MKLRYKILLIFLGLFIPALVFEIGLRLTHTGVSVYRTDPSTGLITLKPNDNFNWNSNCFNNEVSTNALGFHDNQYTTDKSNNVYRIAVIGDSFVEALQVPTDKTFHNLLEQKLNEAIGSSGKKIEVYSFGKSGNGTFANDLFLRRYALQYHPDLIIDSFYEGNDIVDDSEVLGKINEVQTGDTSINDYPYAQFDSNGNVINTSSVSTFQSEQKKLPFYKKITAFIINKSYLAAWLYRKYVNVKIIYKAEKDSGTQSSNVLEQVYSSNYNDTWNQAWQNEGKIFADMQEVSTQSGAKFMVVAIPSSQSLLNQSTNELDYTKPEQLLSKISETQGFDYLPLLPVFVNNYQNDSTDPYFTCDIHWNQTGHAWAADALANYLLQHKELLGLTN